MTLMVYAVPLQCQRPRNREVCSSRPTRRSKSCPRTRTTPFDRQIHQHRDKSSFGSMDGGDERKPEGHVQEMGARHARRKAHSHGAGAQGQTKRGGLRRHQGGLGSTHMGRVHTLFKTTEKLEKEKDASKSSPADTSDIWLDTLLQTYTESGCRSYVVQL